MLHSLAAPIGSSTLPLRLSRDSPALIPCCPASYLVTTYQTSPTLSYNFAYGGATVDASLDPPNDPTIHTIVDQINIFNRNLVPAPSYAPWTPQNSLFAIWIGINDVAETFTRPDEVALLGKIMDSYFAQVQIIYNSGARNFLFVGVPRKFFRLFPPRS